MEVIPSQIKDLGVVRRALFASVYLPKACPNYWSVVAQFATMNSQLGKDLDSTTVKTMIENLQLLNTTAFATDKQLMDEIHTLHCFRNEPLGIVLVSPKEKCALCSGKLLIRSDRPSHLTVFTESFGTVVGTHYHKYCHNHKKGCSFRQYYGYHSEGDQSVIFYDTNWAQMQYFVSSSETAFEVKMLAKFDAELLLGQISYKQKADIYNYSHSYEVEPKRCSMYEHTIHELPQSSERVKQLHIRVKLDRRRFESAHLRFAILNVSSRYSEVDGPIPMHSNMADTLQIFTPKFYKAFERKYSGHTCKYPGCKEVLVIDGNMKNRRDVCMAKDAGCIQYPGLPGHIKSGCTASPQFKSRYCQEHDNRACIPQCTDEEGDPIAEMILEKKTTRSNTFYKVLWLGKPELEVTWESAASLPPAIIQEFEQGVQSQVVTRTDDQYGQKKCVLSVSSNKPDDVALKKPRVERPVINKSTGAFAAGDDDDSTPLSCNTEKDRHRLNFRTAGILAGMRPCGVIVLLGELFISESKTQVYGYLHNFFAMHPDVAKCIEFICYDDACHLTKFAKNKKRAELTEQTRQLASVKMAVDKMHMKGHTDSWCKDNCDPHKFPQLEKVDTEVCEQVFSWLSKYKRITQKMNQHTFMFFMLYLCDLHNIREQQKLVRADFM